MAYKQCIKNNTIQKLINNIFMTLTLTTMITLTSPVQVFCSEEPADGQTKYSSTYLNLRDGAGTKYERITTIAPNTEVKIMEELANGWAKIIYQNKNYFCSQKYLIDKQNNTDTYMAENTNPYNNKVIGEEGTNPNIVKSANEYWNKNIPNWLKESFINNGWNVIISGTSLKTRFGYNMSIAGITNYEAKTIYVDNRQNPVDRGTISHELGHYFDEIHGFPSQSPEFKEIFEREKMNFNYGGAVGDKHEISNQLEYFASVFQDVIIDEDKTKTQIPESYNFICKYIAITKEQSTNEQDNEIMHNAQQIY